MPSYFTALFLVFGGLFFTVLAIYFLLDLRKREKLAKIEKMEFKEEHRKLLKKTPHYNNLSKEDKEKVERSILRFIYTKKFIGANIDVNDEMKIIIAFYACLLLLHIETKNCYDNLKTIIIYPHAVAYDRIANEGGIFTKEQFYISGQSANDTVIIIWHDLKQEAYHLRHNNVAVHEFAHEIDFLDGEIDGVPPIEKSKYNEWSRVLFGEYNKLSEVALKDRDWGKYKTIGAYAATNEAEFFAVITERYFESPESLYKNFPDLYNELNSFYKMDTRKLLQNTKA